MKTCLPISTITKRTIGGAPEVVGLASAIRNRIVAIRAVGSRVTCSPAPVDTDEDWLILLTDDRIDPEQPEDETVFQEIAALGFVQDGDPQTYTGMKEGGFRSWRKGNVNVVTTRDAVFFDRFMAATMLAKRFNLMDKKDRIALFQGVLYGVSPDRLLHSAVDAFETDGLRRPVFEASFRPVR
jgi:hypothetical protein